MKIVRELERRKNRLIRDFLKEIVGDKDDKSFKPVIEDETRARKIREAFLNVVNSLYRDALMYIAAQEGIVLQSFEALAKQNLPESFSVEALIEKQHERNLKKREEIRVRRADGKEEEKA